MSGLESIEALLTYEPYKDLCQLVNVDLEQPHLVMSSELYIERLTSLKAFLLIHQVHQFLLLNDPYQYLPLMAWINRKCYITRHFTNCWQFLCDKQRSGMSPCSRISRFTSSMPSTNNNDIIHCWKSLTIAKRLV